jgi:hypothetical protein
MGLADSSHGIKFFVPSHPIRSPDTYIMFHMEKRKGKKKCMTYTITYTVIEKKEKENETIYKLIPL